MTTPLNTAMAALYRIAQRFAPTLCWACGAPCLPNVNTRNTSSNLALARMERCWCAQCLPRIKASSTQPRCFNCGLKLGTRLQEFGWQHCRFCRANPCATQQTWVCADYAHPQREWVAHMKYQQKPGLAEGLAAWMLWTLHPQPSPPTQCTHLPQLWVPVPMHPNKLKARGYNQAALLAQQLGKLTGIAVGLDVLVKWQHTDAQATLNKTQRTNNLNHSLACTRSLTGLRVGLVDDVMTTGSTLAACKRLLLEAGALSVIQMAVCRTPE